MVAVEKKGLNFDSRKYMMVIALAGIWVIFAVISKSPATYV